MTINEELTAEIIKSWEQDALTERSLEIFKTQAETYKKTHRSVPCPEECVQHAIEVIQLNWRRLPKDKAIIASSYYGQILKSGYIQKLALKLKNTVDGKIT